MVFMVMVIVMVFMIMLMVFMMMFFLQLRLLVALPLPPFAVFILIVVCFPPIPSPDQLQLPCGTTDLLFAFSQSDSLIKWPNWDWDIIEKISSLIIHCIISNFGVFLNQIVPAKPNQVYQSKDSFCSSILSRCLFGFLDIWNVFSQCFHICKYFCNIPAQQLHRKSQWHLAKWSLVFDGFQRWKNNNNNTFFSSKWWWWWGGGGGG